MRQLRYSQARTYRRNLTHAQRRAIDRDDIGWLGWDAHGRPVLRDDHCRYAVTKNGTRIRPTEPVRE